MTDNLYHFIKLCHYITSCIPIYLRLQEAHWLKFQISYTILPICENNTQIGNWKLFLYKKVVLIVYNVLANDMFNCTDLSASYLFELNSFLGTKYEFDMTFKPNSTSAAYLDSIHNTHILLTNTVKQGLLCNDKFCLFLAGLMWGKNLVHRYCLVLSKTPYFTNLCASWETHISIVSFSIIMCEKRLMQLYHCKSYL